MNIYELIEDAKRKLDHLPEINDIPHIKQSDKLAYALTAIDDMNEIISKICDETLTIVMTGDENENDC